VVGQPVEECAGEALRSEGLGPFVEGQIAGNQDRPLLIALGDCHASALKLFGRAAMISNASLIAALYSSWLTSIRITSL